MKGIFAIVLLVSAVAAILANCASDGDNASDTKIPQAASLPILQGKIQN